ncbi:hypothetical protein U9M48_016543 [Paspalum notatum var. saurae]|uniref:Uncharacterized protein n=1 Tax=Paspalum notatum var. saurae TaxID=547442 RepID=A0AAQ3T9P0_PASNO
MSPSSSLTALHIHGSGKPVLSASTDDKLVVASVYFAHVTVWTQQQQDDDGASWPRTTVFRIPPAMPYELPNEDWFNLSRGSMLGLFRSGAVFIIDLDNKVMEKE